MSKYFDAKKTGKHIHFVLPNKNELMHTNSEPFYGNIELESKLNSSAQIQKFRRRKNFRQKF